MKKKAAPRKLITLLSCVLAGLVVSFFALKTIHEKPGRKLPLPYFPAPKYLKNEVDYTQAQILFIGDQMLDGLKRYQSLFKTDLSKGLDQLLKIKYLPLKNESLARSLALLKELPKLPPLIVYHGGKSEFFEKTFSLNNYKLLKQNLRTYSSSIRGSLIQFNLLFAKLFYHPVKFYQLDDEISRDLSPYPDQLRQKRTELIFKYYEIELRELIRYVYEQGSHLIIVSTPINYEIPPGKVCKNASSPEIASGLKTIWKIFAAEDYKEAYQQILELQQISIAHTEVFYLMGKILEKLGRYEEAIINLEQAKAYDCQQDGAHPIINIIQKQYSEKYGISFIDFNQLLKDDFGKNTLFLNKDFPQEIYYEKLYHKVKSLIKEKMGL